MDKRRLVGSLLALSVGGWLVASAVAPAGGQESGQWTSTSLRGGPVYGLAVSKLAPSKTVPWVTQVVFATGTRVLTTDRGETWTPRPGTGVALDVVAGLEGVAFVSAASGEGYRTRNGGDTWNRITVRSGEAARFLAVSPDYKFDKAAYALTLSDWRLYQTYNEGANWQEVKVEVERQYENAAVAYSPHHDFDETVIVATSIGVYKWTRDQRQWTLMSKPGGGLPAFGSEGGPASCQSLVLPAEYGDDPLRASDPDLRTIFATNAMGVYRSDDDGETWTEVNLPADVQQVNGLAVSNGWPADPVLLVAVSAPGAVGYVSTDNGATWRSVPARDGLVGTDAALAADFVPLPVPDWATRLMLPIVLRSAPLGDPPETYLRRVMYLATDGDGVYRSTDGGATWQPAPETFTNVQVTALAPLGDVTGPVLAGTASSGLYRSGDGGQTWSFVDSGLPRGSGQRVTAIRPSPTFDRDQTVYALHAAGLWASRDGGASWTKTSGPANGRALAVSPSHDTDRTVLVDGQISSDGGGTWNALPGADAYPWSAAAFSPSYDTDGRVWWGTDYETRETFYPIRYWDADEESWVVVEKPELAREQVYGLVTMQVDPAEPFRIFAATGHGVRGSLDGGEKWLRLGSYSSRMVDIAGAVVSRPYRNGFVLSGGDAGATWSVNRGEDWERDPRSPGDVVAVGLTRDGLGYLIAVPAEVARLETGGGLLDTGPGTGR